MMFLWFPFLLLIPVAIFWMMRPGEGMGCCGATHAGHARTPGPNGPDPMEIARQRFARGEITTAEFEEIRRVIG
jgi:uncharacterized membrane protein